MARLVNYQTSFADGQVSPKLKGFVDTATYKSSVADLKNFVVIPQGAVSRRPGTRYVTSTKSNFQSRLVPFNFGQDQAYILEFGNLFVRFYQSNAQVLSGGSAFEIDSPYSTSALDGMSFAQSADVLYIAHPSYQPRMLIRSGALDWEFETFWSKDGPYDLINSNESAKLQVTTTVPTSGKIEVGEPQVDITDDFFLLTNHDLLDGMVVRFTLASGSWPEWHGTLSTGGTPTAFNATKDWYVVNATATTFQVAETLVGRPVYLRASNDTVKVIKQIHAKGSAVTMKIGNGTSAQWTNSGTKTKDTIHTYPSASSAVTPSDGSTDLLFTDTAHGLLNDDIIQFRASGSMPDGISVSTNYYVKKLTDDTFNISLTPSTGANTTIDYSSSGSGAGSGVSWYKNKFYTAVVTHTGSASNYPTSVLGNDVWEELAINSGLGFVTTDNDSLMRFNPLTGSAIKWGYIQIDSVTNGLTITATVKEEIASSGANHEWRKSVWNDGDGWPRSVEIFQQRLTFGGNNTFPQTVWFSKTGDYDKFSPSEQIGMATGNVSASGARIVGEQIKDDNAISLTISSATVDLIDWMRSGKKLTIGTSGGVFQMYGSETEITLTPFNFTVDHVTSYPTETNVLPLLIDQQVIYVQKNKRKVREIAYKIKIGDTNATDLTLRADNISIKNIEQIVYQDMPNNIVWCRMGDGKLTAMTYNQSLQMSAWSNHVIGGTDVVVESLAVIPTTTHDQLWMIVKRTVNTNTVRYIEFMDRFYDSGYLNSDDAHFVDSGVYDEVGAVTGVFTVNTSTEVITSSGHDRITDDVIQVSSATTLPGGLVAGTNYWIHKIDANTFKLKPNSSTTLDFVDITTTGTGVHTWTLKKKRTIPVTHLKNESLRILSDSSLQNNKTVDGTTGDIIMDLAGAKVHAGLAFDSYITTLDLAEGPTGILVGNRKKIHRIVIKMLDTMGVKFGPTIADLDEVIFRFPTDELGEAIAFFSGDKTLTLGNMSYEDHHVVVGQDGPFPMSILLLGFDYDSNDL